MGTRKLLVSVFNAEEVRAAIEGGADVIDCEDPRADVGMFEPRVVTDIAYAVRQNAGLRVVPTSANIGFALQLFERAGTGQAAPRSDIEVHAKAAQEALGLAAAMDVGDGRPNIVKFGVDGLPRDRIGPLVKSVKDALRNSHRYQNHRVIGSFLEIDRAEWARRKADKTVIKGVLDVGLFYFTEKGAIDLNDYYDKERAKAIMENQSSHSRVDLIDPFKPEALGLPDDLEERMRLYAKLIREGGADGVMIDTPIQAKVARICLVKHKKNKEDTSGGKKLPRKGVFDIEMLERFAAYCAFLEAESWLAGSIQPHHAKELGKIDALDVVLCRGSASDVVVNPYGAHGDDDRRSRRVTEAKVRAMADNLKGKASKAG